MPQVASRKRHLTPPQLARRYGVKPEKVIGWIVGGELRAINIAASPTGRPRWIIDEADVAVFEERRAAKAPSPEPPRRKRSADLPAGWIKYF
jgi:hypothetical protein